MILIEEESDGIGAAVKNLRTDIGLVLHFINARFMFQ
jgi:hypothetical protein